MKPLVYKRRARGPQPFRAPQPVLGVTKGDTVRVIRGEFKGKEGKVLRVYPRKARVVVEGLKVVKKHKRATEQAEGGIETQHDARRVLGRDGAQFRGPDRLRPGGVGCRMHQPFEPRHVRQIDELPAGRKRGEEARELGAVFREARPARRMRA